MTKKNTILAYTIGLILFHSSSGYASVDFQSNALQIEEKKQANQIQKNTLTARYGDWLFNGAFQNNTFSAINPNYRLTQGDNILIQIWGAIDYQAEVKVDPQGNIFIPKVGPVNVVGVSNKKLNDVVFKHVQRVYKSNVEVYVSLMSSQKVKVFLSGMVTNPGLYEGQSADSVLRFIDLAGGIRTDLGSYRQIDVKRNNKIITSIDLYAFLQQGKMPSLQLQDGDVIVVSTKSGEISIDGDVGFKGKYELPKNKKDIWLSDVLKVVIPNEHATHVTLISPVEATKSVLSSLNKVEAKQYSLDKMAFIPIKSGSLIKVSSQMRAKSISVDLLGEHESAQELVLPWGASLADLLAQTQFSALSDKSAIQLYRQSVADRQFDMLQASLSSLEQSVLTQRSNSKEAAELRVAESKIITQWIEKARKVKPKGQVLLTEGSDLSKITLQQGDKIVIPQKRNLVLVHGEVMFPTAIAYKDNLSIKDYIDQAGGTNQDLDDMNILVMKPNGGFIKANKKLNRESLIQPSDEIFVLAPPDEKKVQFASDITKIMYQIAMSAAVVLAI